jgi:hypothetical protein
MSSITANLDNNRSFNLFVALQGKKGIDRLCQIYRKSTSSKSLKLEAKAQAEQLTSNINY